MKNKYLMTIAFLIVTSSLAAQVADKDGYKYKTVKIGKQEWMAENLNVSHFRNGDPIPEIKDAGAWEKAGQDGEPAWCYYDNDPANGRAYHKLYNWYAVNDPRGLAPNGWHVPSTLEWADLWDYLGGDSVAGETMKATSGWENVGTNESGFAGLPGGWRSTSGQDGFMGRYSFWWSSSADSSKGTAWATGLQDNERTGRLEDYKETGNYVRCVRD